MKFLPLFLKVLNFALLLGNCILVVYYYFQLPQVIPTHFDLNGIADGFGDKKMLFFELIIAFVLWMLLQYMSENPNTPGLNIPENLRENKNLTRIFVQAMLFFVMVLFLGISFSTIEVSLGKEEVLGFFPLVVIGLMLVFMVVFFICVPSKK